MTDPDQSGPDPSTPAPSDADASGVEQPEPAPEREPHLVPPDSVPPVSAEPYDPDEPRRYPSTIGGLLYLVVLAVVAVGLGVVVFGEWRTGVRVMGGALLAAAAARLLLRHRDAGMLAVRHKVLDAVVLIVLGSLMIFLAGSIPDQPGGF